MILDGDCSLDKLDPDSSVCHSCQVPTWGSVKWLSSLSLALAKVLWITLPKILPPFMSLVFLEIESSSLSPTLQVWSAWSVLSNDHFIFILACFKGRENTSICWFLSQMPPTVSARAGQNLEAWVPARSRIWAIGTRGLEPAPVASQAFWMLEGRAESGLDPKMGHGYNRWHPDAVPNAHPSATVLSDHLSHYPFPGLPPLGHFLTVLLTAKFNLSHCKTLL